MHPYRGAHRRLDRLAIGESSLLRTPAGMSLQDHRRSVTNAVNHLNRSRDRPGRLKVRAELHGVRVTRVQPMTMDEAVSALDRLVPLKI